MQEIVNNLTAAGGHYGVAVRAGVPVARSTLRTKGVRMKSGRLKVRRRSLSLQRRCFHWRLHLSPLRQGDSEDEKPSGETG